MIRRLFLMATVLVVTSAASAAADWLVLRRGGVLETRGAWEIKGKLILFHRADGSLASMRLEEVDLDLSRRRTEAAKAPKPKPVAKPERKVEAVLVLTDADVAHVDRATLEPKSGGRTARATESTGGDEEAGSEPVTLQVTGWERLDDPEFLGIKLGGTLRNDSPESALDIGLTARLLDDAGRTIGRARATVDTRALAPGDSTRFEVGFAGVFGYDSIEFAPRSISAAQERGGNG